MSSDNTEYISERIRVTNSYREASSLRDQVWALSGKIELKKFMVLRDKVEKKLKEFDRPVFNDARVAVKFDHGEAFIIDSREVNIVMGKGQNLSDYVFRQFPNALDFEITYGGLDDSTPRSKNEEENENKLELNSMFPPKTGSVREGVERIVKLALKLVNFLVSTYMKAFPSIADELKIIKEKLEDLFDKVSVSYY